MKSFKTKVDIINGNPFVFVPKDILQDIFKEFGKDKGPVPVIGKLNGAPFKQTLVRYQGDWRLYLNIIMLKAGGITFKPGHGNILSVVGKDVKIEIGADLESRKLPMHPKLKKELDKDPIAKKAYEELAPYRKHEILRYLGFMKTETSTDKNIERIIKHLRNEPTDALYPLMHRQK